MSLCKLTAQPLTAGWHTSPLPGISHSLCPLTHTIHHTTHLATLYFCLQADKPAAQSNDWGAGDDVIDAMVTQLQEATAGLPADFRLQPVVFEKVCLLPLFCFEVIFSWGGGGDCNTTVLWKEGGRGGSEGTGTRLCCVAALEVLSVPLDTFHRTTTPTITWT